MKYVDMKNAFYKFSIMQHISSALNFWQEFTFFRRFYLFASGREICGSSAVKK